MTHTQKLGFGTRIAEEIRREPGGLNCRVETETG